MDRKRKIVIGILDEIMDNFDFEKVKTVMDNLDWKWCGMMRLDIQTGKLKVKSDVPTLDEITQTAANLLWNLATDPDPENTFCAMGGFRAERDFTDPDNPWMRLSFEVTDWDANGLDTFFG